MGSSTVFGKRINQISKNVRRVGSALLVAGMAMAAASPALANAKYAGIVVDAKTGKTLYADSADSYRYPASLTKIMTLYIVFEELEAGRLSLNSELKVSKNASLEPPSKIGLKPGQTIKVKDAILALVTKSANDVATTVAENIGGSEANFAKRMTRTARQIGMKKTTFRNAHGLPNKSQRTTARDMATLGIAIQERFPKYYDFFQTKVYTYKGRRYGNHNKLLGRVRGVDGIKTGYIRASGFNLVTSVNRDNRHIVAVVMGGRTGASRNAQMTNLIGRYLPKASKGRKAEPLIVQNKSRPSKDSPVFVAANMKSVPMPESKPGSSKPEASSVLALAPTKPLANVPFPINADAPVPPKPVVDANGSRFDQAFAAAALPPVPVSAPVRSNDAVAIKAVATSTIKVESDDVVAVATNNARDQAPSWQVQIAATETEGDALQMLKRAAKATGSVLRKQVPYTEPVKSNGQTLYRARFVGFETKTAAWNACKSLKRAKFPCYAIYQ